MKSSLEEERAIGLAQVDFRVDGEVGWDRGFCLQAESAMALCRLVDHAAASSCSGLVPMRIEPGGAKPEPQANEPLVKFEFIRMPDSTCYPENCCQSFNVRPRDELLNETLFTSLGQGRTALATSKDDYNNARPHCALGNLMPTEFADRCAKGRNGAGRCAMPKDPWPAPLLHRGVWPIYNRTLPIAG
jgi:putative transposase